MIDEPEPRRDTSAKERPGATAAARAWNERYPRTRQVWGGEPNATLVAELEGLASGRALDRVFQQALGQAPMKYLVDWRMTLARDLLLTQNLPMTEIADRIGYSSPHRIRGGVPPTARPASRTMATATGINRLRRHPHALTQRRAWSPAMSPGLSTKRCN